MNLEVHQYGSHMRRLRPGATNTIAFLRTLAIACLITLSCGPLSSKAPSAGAPRPTSIWILKMTTPMSGWARVFQPRTSDAPERVLLVRTNDGGSNWRDVTPPGMTPSGGATPAEFLDQNTGWIMASAHRRRGSSLERGDHPGP
jgi:hypothetical protein